MATLSYRERPAVGGWGVQARFPDADGLRRG